MQHKLFPEDMGTAGETKASTEALKADQKLSEQQTKLAYDKAQAALKADQDIERSQLQHAQSRAKTEDQTADQFAAAQKYIVGIHLASQLKILDDALAIAGLRKEAEQKLQEQRKLIIQKASEEIVKIEDKAAEEEKKRADAINKEIARTASSGIVDLAWGKTTPGQAIASTAQDLEKRALDKGFEKLLDASGVGGMLDKAFSGITSGLFGGLGGGAKATGDTALGTASTAAATSVAALGTAAGAAATALGATVSTGVALTGTFTGSTAAIGADTVWRVGNSAATGVNTAATAFNTVATQANSTAQAGSSGGGFLGFLFNLLPKFEQGGIVPSAAGGWSVPNVGSGSIMAQLHSNEMVLPSGISSFIQNAASSAGGGTKANPVHFAYSPTINAPEQMNMKQMLSRHGNDMLSWMQAQFRSGALRVPA